MPAPLAPDFRPEYHELHRVGRPGWWRSMLGAIVLVALVFGIVPAVLGLAALVALLVGGTSAQDAASMLDISTEVTPAGLAAVNVLLGSAILSAWFVQWLFHRLKPRWLSSIAPRLRWRYLLACLPLAVVALVASLGAALLVPSGGAGEPVGALNDFTSTTRDFLIVIALLTPLQAAGEEYVFRGYLTQAFGSLLPWRRVSLVLAVLAPAVLFALAHGFGQSWPVFFDRFAFGVVAGILVIRTGGLEAAIAMHVLNNFFAYALALSFGDMTESLNATGPSSPWMIVSTLTQSLVYLGLATWVAKVMGVSRQGPPVGGARPPVADAPGQEGPVLDAPPPRV